VSTLNDIITGTLMLVGAGFMLLAAVGVTRLPDLYIRMHAATKSGTLGVTSMMLAAAVHFGQFGVTTRVVLIILFLYLTAPVAAHMIGRAAYLVGVPTWEGSVVDDLKGHYDSSTHQLASDDAALPDDDPGRPQPGT
jgi:multicomponent Na+:H+ antiporter subunit G